MAVAVVADEGDVGNRRVGNRSGGEVITIVVALHQAVALAQSLISHEELCTAVPAFCPVEAVVGAVDYHSMFNVHASAEELKTVIRAIVCLYIFYRRTVTYAIEGDAVSLVFGVERITGILDTHVAQCTAVVGIIATAIRCIAYFRHTAAAFCIGVCTAANVQATPSAQLLTFGSHDNGILSCSDGLNLGPLTNQNEVGHLVINGNDFHAFFNGQRGALGYNVLAAQRVSLVGGKGFVFGQFAFQCLYGIVYAFIAVAFCANPACCPVVVGRNGALVSGGFKEVVYGRHVCTTGDGAEEAVGKRAAEIEVDGVVVGFCRKEGRRVDSRGRFRFRLRIGVGIRVGCRVIVIAASGKHGHGCNGCHRHEFQI